MDSQHQVYVRPDTKPTISIPADFGQDVMRQVIGKDGCYFKMTTQNTSVEFIWFDMNSNEIFIWGDLDKANKASNIISYRIKNIITRMINSSQTIPQNCLDFIKK